MTRAIPVDDRFDPVPSLIAVRTIDVSVASAIPDGVGTVVELVSTSPQRANHAALEAVGFTGALGDVHVVAGPPATVLVGVGATPLGLASGRDIGAAAAGAIPGALELAIDVGDANAEVAQGIVEGIILARYSWDALRSEPARTQVNSITLVSPSDAVAAGARRGHLKALATAVSRRPGELPASASHRRPLGGDRRTSCTGVRPRRRDP